KKRVLSSLPLSSKFTRILAASSWVPSSIRDGVYVQASSFGLPGVTSRQGMSHIYVTKSPQTENPIGNDAGNTVINSDDGNLVIATVQEEATDHVPDPIEGKVSGECPSEAEQETTDAAPHVLEPDPNQCIPKEETECPSESEHETTDAAPHALEPDLDQCTIKGETPKVSRDTEVVTSSQVISLDRACCASSVTVMHTYENSDAASAGHQEDQNSSPFF
ncbi:hypothetical protein HID58_071625, partial [Brassica napus]